MPILTCKRLRRKGVRLPLDRPQLSVPYLATSYLSLLSLSFQIERALTHRVWRYIAESTVVCTSCALPAIHVALRAGGGAGTRPAATSEHDEPSRRLGLKLLVAQGHMSADSNNALQY